MPDATRLHYFRWRKKKVDGYIIPANHFYGRVFEIPVKGPEIIEVKVPEPIAVPVPEPVPVQPEVKKPMPEIKVSALSLASIRAKNELEQTMKSHVKEAVHLPTEPFTETDMLLQWNKYAQRLADKGQKIMESYLLINDPKLRGTTIIHELPNAGSKVDFESEKHNLLGYLRGKLHNHDITIEVVVNESIENRKAFSNQDKFNRLNEINPGIDLLRRTFDLDL